MLRDGGGEENPAQLLPTAAVGLRIPCGNEGSRYARAPLLLVVLGAAPPVLIAGEGRMAIHDAIARQLPTVHGLTSGHPVPFDELPPASPMSAPGSPGASSSTSYWSSRPSQHCRPVDLRIGQPTRHVDSPVSDTAFLIISRRAKFRLGWTTCHTRQAVRMPVPNTGTVLGFDWRHDNDLELQLGLRVHHLTEIATVSSRGTPPTASTRRYSIADTRPTAAA